MPGMERGDVVFSCTVLVCDIGEAAFLLGQG